MARAKIFKHGGSQAVRLPKAFRFEVSEVEVRKEGDRLVLEPIRDARRTPEEWRAFWADIDELRGDEELVRQPQPELRDIKFDD